MIIKIEQVKLVLYNRALTGYSLEASGIGLTRQAISQIRSKGEENFDNLPIGTIMKIQRWIDDGNFKISYDYSKLLEEIYTDYAEGLITNKLYVVRGEWLEAINNAPIIDFYYDLEQVKENEIVQEMETEAVIAEMELFNRLF